MVIIVTWCYWCERVGASAAFRARRGEKEMDKGPDSASQNATDGKKGMPKRGACGSLLKIALCMFERLNDDLTRSGPFSFFPLARLELSFRWRKSEMSQRKNPEEDERKAEREKNGARKTLSSLYSEMGERRKKRRKFSLFPFQFEWVQVGVLSFPTHFSPLRVRPF